MSSSRRLHCQLGLAGTVDAPVAGGRDEVEEDVHAVVAEAGVTLDARLLGEDVVVLSLEVANDLGEASKSAQSGVQGEVEPGLVVNLVAESRRVDYCQADAGAFLVELWAQSAPFRQRTLRTNGDGLDFDAILDVGHGGVVGVLVVEDALAAEGVDEGCAAWRDERWAFAETSNIPVPEAPHTIRQNWMPFLTFFFRRI